MTNIAYLAGLIDGEGHIAIFRRKPMPPYISSRYSLRLEICMCSLKTIQWIQEHFNGTIYKKRRTRTIDTGKLRKQSYAISWPGRKASDLLQKVKPFLITKSLEADIAIKYQLQCPPKTYKLSEDELDRREKAYRLLRKAKL